MSKIIFSGNQKYNLDSLCGTAKRIILYIQRGVITNKLPGSKKNNLDVDFISKPDLKIEDLIERYNIKKYYIKGKYDTERIIQCCILPCEIIETYDIYNGYLFFNFSSDNKELKDIMKLYKEDKIDSNLEYNIELYENPFEAGKEYILSQLDKKKNEYDNIVKEYNNLDSSFINKQIKEIEEKYENLKKSEIQKFLNETEEKKKVLSEKKNDIILYFNRNKDISNKLGINIEEYNIV